MKFNQIVILSMIFGDWESYKYDKFVIIKFVYIKYVNKVKVILKLTTHCTHL